MAKKEIVIFQATHLVHEKEKLSVSHHYPCFLSRIRSTAVLHYVVWFRLAMKKGGKMYVFRN